MEAHCTLQYPSFRLGFARRVGAYIRSIVSGSADGWLGFEATEEVLRQVQNNWDDEAAEALARRAKANRPW